jgi:hypothetical protein
MIGVTNPFGNNARDTAEACRQGTEIAGANFEQGDCFGGTASRAHRGTAGSWKRQGRRPGRHRHGGKGHQ